MISLFDDPAFQAGHRQNRPLLSSLAVHGLAAALLAAMVPGRTPPHRDEHLRAYRVQLIHFSSADLRAPVLPGLRQPAKRRSSARGVQGKAKQTLIVPDAPPEIALSESIPLPLAVAAIPLKPEAYRVPTNANVVSLPDELVNAKDMLAPKVNQVAAGEHGDGGAHGAAETNSNYQTNSNYETNSNGAQESEKTGLATSLPGTTRIDKDREGRFAASVLGASALAEQYPDIATGMTGKIVSTVYLSVGTKPNWTLEFCEEAGGRAAGVDAPWPYTIFRPDRLEVPAGAEAILVKGSLTATGEFEHLEIVLPEDWPGKDALLTALNAWRFRPAMRQGRPVAVQILLVIPQRVADQ